MPPAVRPAASYRTTSRVGPDPVTEADVIIELIHRTTALRRRLLVASLGVSVVAGAGAAVLYVGVAERIYGRVTGAFFAAGMILAFVVLRRLSNALARARESAWIAELVERYAVSAEPLREALGMFAPGEPLPPPSSPSRPVRRMRRYERHRD